MTAPDLSGNSQAGTPGSPSEGHEMPDEPAEAGVMAPAMVGRRGI